MGMDFTNIENTVHTYDQKTGFCMQVQTKPKEDKRIPIEQKTDVIQTRFFITDLTNPIDENIVELIELLEMRYEKIEWEGRICKDQFDKNGVDLNEVFLVLCDNVYSVVQWKRLNLTCVEID